MSERHLPFPQLPDLTDEERIARARAAYERLKTRHTCRAFTDAPVPREVIEAAILAAGTAPNGANHQPWHFVAVSSPEKKRAIREAAEARSGRSMRARRATSGSMRSPRSVQTRTSPSSKPRRG